MEVPSTRFRIIPALIAIGLLTVAVTAGLPVDAAGPSVVQETAESSPIVIGILQYEKFAFADMMRSAFDMARERANREGGVRGRPLKLVYANDKADPRVGEKVVRELVKNQGAVMLVGGYSSSNTVYMAGMAEKLDRPFLVTTAADDRITERKWRNVFRLNPPASGYTQGVEGFFLDTVKPESIAIVYENSPYGTDGALRMMWFCRENRIEIRKILPYHRERTDPAYIRRILSPLQDEPPDVIYMVSYLRDAIVLTRELRSMKIGSLLVGGAGGFTHPDFIKNSGADGNLVLTATLWFQKLRYPGIREFHEEFLDRTGIVPDYHAAEAYSAVMVATDVLRRAESLRPESIRAALDNTDMSTPFGPVRFSSYDRFERQNHLPTQVLQVIQGRLECVWPEELMTASFAPPPEWRRKTGRKRGSATNE